jgi:hypothetical protein
MRSKRRSLTRSHVLFFLAACVGTAIGCGSSPEAYANERRQRLLAIYPPGKTSRADVQAKWPVQPEISEARPAGGWSACAHAAIRERAATSERRTGRTVERCERYFGPDGISGSLCYVWFYYDERDDLVDAEWQFHTD